MYEEYFNHTPQTKMKDFYLNEIAPLGNQKSYKKNDQIDYFPNSKLAIVTEGRLKICIYTKSGLEKILFFLNPGEIYGEESLFYPHIDITPVPLEATTISFIDNEVLQNYLISHPMDYRYLFQSILRKYQISLFQMGDLLKRSPKAQICSALSRLMAQRSTTNSSIDFYELDVYLTHEVLGNIIGCSRVTVTRVLNELKAEGIIDTSNRRIKILDIEALKNLSE
ncbi:Crp/Fnr family transcriptional regulator [Clostridium culturomicium]|uniref:Crp/Fnr family transcriptional regulator n=2 Tax=Clostridium culturomicium TaxID=1499683 RepID=UPI00058B62D9